MWRKIWIPTGPAGAKYWVVCDSDSSCVAAPLWLTREPTYFQSLSFGSHIYFFRSSSSSRVIVNKTTTKTHYQRKRKRLKMVGEDILLVQPSLVYHCKNSGHNRLATNYWYQAEQQEVLQEHHKDLLSYPRSLRIHLNGTLLPSSPGTGISFRRILSRRCEFLFTFETFRSKSLIINIIISRHE